MESVCGSVLSVLLAMFVVFPLTTSLPAAAQLFGSGNGIQSMKLLTRDVGWASSRQKVFWTSDAGRHWKDITPHAEDRESIASVFFLDGSRGWVLFSEYDEPQPRFDLATTTDAGGNWSHTTLVTAGLTPVEATLGTTARMYFLDSLHGWINLSAVSSAAAHSGAALTTLDGGKTWNWVQKGAGSAGAVVFNTITDGWIVSPAGDALYATHDGSKSWQGVSLRAPAEMHLAGAVSTYRLPIFQDGKHGFISVAFSDGTNGAELQFATSDGGIDWRFSRVLPPTGGADAIVQSFWMAVSLSKQHVLSITRLALQSNPTAPATVSADVGRFAGLHELGGPPDSREEVSFVDVDNGWVLAGELLATADGGGTWTDITPTKARPMSRVAPVPAPRLQWPAAGKGPGFPKHPLLPRSTSALVST